MPKILVNLGDRDPFNHGGFFVVESEYGPQGVRVEPNGDTVRVWRFDISEDPMGDLDWVDWPRAARAAGMEMSLVRNWAESKKVGYRARIYQTAGWYEGYDSLDTDPQELDEREFQKLYGKALDKYLNAGN